MAAKRFAELDILRGVAIFFAWNFFQCVAFYFRNFFVERFFDFRFFSQAVERGRFFGILQRLALTYFFGMCLIKFLRSDKKIFLAAFGILIFYSASFHIYLPENSFAIEKNIFDSTDLIFFGENHLYTPTHDPEGFFGTFSSVAEFLLGFLAGKILLKNISVREKIYKFIFCGGIFLTVGAIWSNFDIISKNLWTSPFALITAGTEILILAGILKILQTNAKKFLKPLQSIGKNPLFFFFASNFCLIFFLVLEIENIPAWQWIFQHTFLGFVSLKFSSMLFCFAWCGFWIFVAEILDKKNIIIKI